MSITTEMSDITVQEGASAPRILIPGGQGHLGQFLARYFSALGHTVITLTPRPAQSNSRVTWKQLSARHAQSRSSRRHGHEPRARRRFLHPSRPARSRRALGLGSSIYVLDSRHGLCSRHRIPDRSQRNLRPVNLAGPQPLPNAEFLSALRNAWGIGIGLPAPAWMLATGAFFWHTETELLLKSRRVVPAMLLDHGCTFRFPDWPSAAQDLVECIREHRPGIEIPNALFRTGSRELKTDN